MSSSTPTISIPRPPNQPSNPKDPYFYHSGFGNHFESEAIKGALPVGQNTPQVCPYKLYAEQLTGSAFTAGRPNNLRSWLYRLRPSVCHRAFQRLPRSFNKLVPNFTPSPSNSPDDDVQLIPDQLRWSQFDIPQEPTDFVEGLATVAGAGSPMMRAGCAIHMYLANTDMTTYKAFYCSDGDWLIVPQQGRLDVRTEFGMLNVAPNEILVIPRGIRYSVDLPDGPSRGYICEVFNGRFELPDLGPIGANGLANPRDFQAPQAAYEDRDGETFTVYNKYGGFMHMYQQDHSPFDIIAWHGNYHPYKYDLNRFNVVNSTSFDHLDPSIFTVLTCKSAVPGTAVVDFAIFPPRWAVQQWTFRPPYYHRNVASEFMGLIYGEYEAKKGGFLPGGGSMHSMMSAHGPDAITFEQASAATLTPVRVADKTQAFMFESSLMLALTKWALKDCGKVQTDYVEHSWSKLEKHFDPTAKGQK